MLTLVSTVDREALGRAIEARRVQANLSIEEALKRSGLSRTTWRDVEKGRGSFPSRLVLHRMADAVGAQRSAILELAGYSTDDEAIHVDDPKQPLAERVRQLEAQVARLLAEHEGPP